MRSVEIK